MGDTIYRVLLRSLPGWFREEFSGEMRAVFREERLRAAAGQQSVLALWLRTGRDIAALALRLHAESLTQDASYALRTLQRSPVFTLAAVATLALGLGPTLVVANLVQRVVLAPLPFPDADRLVSVWNAQPEKGRHEFPLSIPDYVDFRDRQSAFSALAAHTGTSVAFVGASDPKQITGVLTTPELFAVLGVQPILGRALMPADSAPGAPPVIVIGASFWQSEFGARPGVIGESVRIDGEPTEIVGVLPGGLSYPSGSATAWVPLTIDPASGRGSHFLSATGRLAPGVSAAQAQDAMNGIARSLAEAYPSTNSGQGIEVIRLKDQLNGDAPRLIGVLALAIAAVLLIACTNVASLLSVRATSRGSELAVRTALGATARRLRRQLLVEHLLLTLGGGLSALLIALPLHRAIVERRVLALPATAAGFGWPAFVALVVLVVLIGLLFARLSLRRSTQREPAGLLVATQRQTGTRRTLRFRQGLVIAEVASALILVVIAGLMIRSAARLAEVDPGFRADVLTFGLVLPGPRYMEPASRIQVVTRITEALAALPGVAAVTSGAYAPMGQMRATRRFARADRPPPNPGEEPLALDLPVSPGYFEVLGIRVLEGRTFDARDSAGGPPVLVISETFAREMYPGESAVGKQIAFFTSRPGATPPPSRVIVGVVQDVRQDGVSRQPIPQMYAPYPQTPWGFVSFFIRTDGPAAPVAAALPRVVSGIDPMRPVRDVRSTGDIVSNSTARQRAMTWMLIALAATALLLASVGLYGVSATAASARAREMAIRAAVGADPGTLKRLVIGQALTAAGIGIVIGIAGSLAATRALGSLLYEIPARDPVTLAATAALLLIISGLAAYLPARRALARNPAEVLRASV